MNQIKNTENHQVIMYRTQEQDRKRVSFKFDDQPVDGLEGDSILIAILNHFPYLRKNEFSHQPRSGFRNNFV